MLDPKGQVPVAAGAVAIPQPELRVRAGEVHVRSVGQQSDCRVVIFDGFRVLPKRFVSLSPPQIAFLVRLEVERRGELRGGTLRIAPVAENNSHCRVGHGQMGIQFERVSEVFEGGIGLMKSLANQSLL